MGSSQDDAAAPRRAAQRLAEAEERFRSAFDNAAIGMTITSLDGRWLRVNPAFCAMLGRAADELVDHTVRSVSHPDHIDADVAAMRRMAAGEQDTYRTEKRYLRADGGIVWVDLTASVVRDGDRPKYFVGQMVDITERRRAEDRFRTLATAAPNGVWATDVDGNLTYVNDRLLELTGRPADELLGAGWMEIVAPGDRDRISARLTGSADEAIEHLILMPSGEHRWVRRHGGVTHDDAGHHTGHVGSLEDITEEVQARHELARREAELRLLAENSSDFLSRLGPDLTFRYASPACVPLTGFTPEELVGTNVLDHAVDSEVHMIEAARAGRFSQGSETLVFRIRRKDGQVVWFETTVRAVRDGEGEVIELVSVSRDISERKAAEMELSHQALHDALTGLPNRVLFLDRLNQALLRGVRRGTGSNAVLFLDVDRFKLVNDSLGHEAGDRLLVEVALRLDTALRPADTVARFGGDEFTILCEDVAGELEAVAIAQRVVELFAEPFELDGTEVFLTTSVGVALSGPLKSRPDDLIRDADAAMYRAKERGKNRYELYDDAMRAFAVHRLDTESALRRAVQRDELRVHLQPQIDLTRNDVVGFEALVRWEHHERGLIPPGDFIPLAEESGLIVEIGTWVLHEACREAVRWRESGLTMSVNVSARQLSQPDFVDVVAHALEETATPPHLLMLELTESAVIESGAGTVTTLNGLKALGVKIAIDDFGTGYSSLGHLRRFPLDVLKLDRSFVAGLGSEPQDASIASAVISLAHALGLETVAEGIETPAQLAVLVSLGCDMGQGFLWAKPEPAADILLDGRRLRAA